MFLLLWSPLITLLTRYVHGSLPFLSKVYSFTYSDNDGAADEFSPGQLDKTSLDYQNQLSKLGTYFAPLMQYFIIVHIILIKH